MNNLFKSIFLVLVSVILISSCSQERQDEIKVQFVESTSKGLSDILASSSILNCAKPEIIKADVKKQLLKFDILVTKDDLQKKSVAQTVCKQAIKYVIPLIISAPIPSEWECENSIVLDISDVIALRACSKF